MALPSGVKVTVTRKRIASGVTQVQALAKRGKRVVGGALAQVGTMRAMRDWRRNGGGGGGFADDWDLFGLEEVIAYFQGLEVEEDERNQGIGRALAVKIVEAGDALGAARQWLVAAPMDSRTEWDGLFEFYGSLGFVALRRTEDDSLMIRVRPVARANPARVGAVRLPKRREDRSDRHLYDLFDVAREVTREAVVATAHLTLAGAATVARASLALALISDTFDSRNDLHFYAFAATLPHVVVIAPADGMVWETMVERMPPGTVVREVLPMFGDRLPKYTLARGAPTFWALRRAFAERAARLIERAIQRRRTRGAHSMDRFVDAFDDQGRAALRAKAFDANQHATRALVQFSTVPTYPGHAELAAGVRGAAAALGRACLDIAAWLDLQGRTRLAAAFRDINQPVLATIDRDVAASLRVVS